MDVQISDGKDALSAFLLIFLVIATVIGVARCTADKQTPTPEPPMAVPTGLPRPS